MSKKDNQIKTQESVEEIQKEAQDNRPYNEVVEEERQKLFKAYKKSKRVSNISMLIVLLFAVGAVLLIEQTEKILQYLGWGLVAVTVIGMLVFYFINKDKLPNQTKAYIKKITDLINNHNFSDGQFTEVGSNPDEKLEHADFIGDSVYADSSSFASRAVVKGKFKGRSFSCSEAGLFKVGPKRTRVTMFVGKYISFTNDLHFENRFVFTNRTEKGDDLPTGLGDLVVLEQDGNFAIYGKEGANYKGEFDSLFLSKIKSIIPNKHLLNVAIVVWGGHSAAYLSYDDDVMSLPFDKPFNTDANEEYKKTLVEVLSTLDLLNKD